MERPVEFDVPLVHQPSPRGRGNRSLRETHGLANFGKVNLAKLPMLNPENMPRGMDEKFPLEFFQEASRPTAIASPPSIIAMSVAWASLRWRLFENSTTSRK